MYFTHVKNTHLARHHEECLTVKTTPNIISPEEGEIYNFNQLRALEKAPYICYFDTEENFVKY